MNSTDLEAGYKDSSALDIVRPESSPKEMRDMEESSSKDLEASMGEPRLGLDCSCLRREADISATSGGSGVGNFVSGEPLAKAYVMKRLRLSFLCEGLMVTIGVEEEAEATAEDEEADAW